jgi:hypothetical protein
MGHFLSEPELLVSHKRPGLILNFLANASFSENEAEVEAGGASVFAGLESV